MHDPELLLRGRLGGRREGGGREGGREGGKTYLDQTLYLGRTCGEGDVEQASEEEEPIFGGHDTGEGGKEGGREGGRKDWVREECGRGSARKGNQYSGLPFSLPSLPFTYEASRKKIRHCLFHLSLISSSGLR